MCDIGVEVVGINIPSVVINPDTRIAKREGPIRIALEISTPEQPINVFSMMHEKEVTEKPSKEKIALVVPVGRHQ